MSTEMDRQGISVAQCAEGFLFARLLNNIGVDEERAESLFAESYNRCVTIEFNPEEIASHLDDLISFATDCKDLRIGIEEAKFGSYLYQIFFLLKPAWAFIVANNQYIIVR